MPLSLDQREQILEREIAKQEAKGYILKTRTQTDAVLVPKHRKKSMANGGCMVVATAGLMLLPEILGIASGMYSKVTIHVNTDGSVEVI